MSAEESWGDEKRSAWLYRRIAEAEAGQPWAPLFARLADEAEAQAGIWADQLKADGRPLPGFAPDLRARVVGALVGWLGARRLRGVLAAMKVRGLSVFAGPAETAGHAMPATLEDVGRRHRGTGGGLLRAAVFGVNDGLVSNASLILGVAGASADGKVVVLSGVAGLLAGAFSMAAGEYVSVRSQREMLEHQLGLEKDELEKYPDEEAKELALIYEARGVPKEDAIRIARKIVSNPTSALQTLAREELGLDPNELGSPWGAAGSSFLAFATGAALPLVPFLLAPSSRALPIAVAITAVALFGVGATISLFTGKQALLGGVRMLLVGGIAGALTWGIGRLLGVSMS